MGKMYRVFSGSRLWATRIGEAATIEGAREIVETVAKDHAGTPVYVRVDHTDETGKTVATGDLVGVMVAVALFRRGGLTRGKLHADIESRSEGNARIIPGLILTEEDERATAKKAEEMGAEAFFTAEIGRDGAGGFIRDIPTHAVIHDDGVKVCADCLCVIEDGDAEEGTSGASYCSACAELYNVCEECGRLIDDNSGAYCHGRDGRVLLCADCRDGAEECDHCGDYFFPRFGGITGIGGAYCPDCEDRVSRCDECGRVEFDADECGWGWDDDDNYLCPECLGNGRIHDRHPGLPLIFHGRGAGKRAPGWFVGFELEIDRDDRDKDNERETAQELCDALGDLGHLERDGSLNNGIEIVSQPCTVDFLRDDFPLARILDIAAGHDYQSHDARTCGLHFHFSREAFGRSRAEKTRAIAKTMYFVERNFADIMRAMRRSDPGWCRAYGAETRAECYSIASNNAVLYDRYKAINLKNARTVEIRAPRGTLKEATFRACLDFWVCVVQNARRVRWDRADDPGAMLAGIAPGTREYLAERGVFGGVI